MGVFGVRVESYFSAKDYLLYEFRLHNPTSMCAPKYPTNHSHYPSYKSHRSLIHDGRFRSMERV